MNNEPSPYSKALRDFVYLDWERVRSLAAQLLEGLPEEGKRESRHDVGTKGRLEASAFTLLKGQGEADHRYFRSTHETRSFHHHVYSLFEDQLIRQELLTIVDSDFVSRNWVPNSFCDGQFVLITGLVRIMDYGWVSSMMESLPELMRISQDAERYTLQKKRNEEDITQKEMDDRLREQRKTADEIKRLKVKDLSDLSRQLYGDAIRVKVLPNNAYHDRMLVGTGRPDHFYDTGAMLSQKYGFEIDAEWVVLGQVNVSRGSSTPRPLPIGNELEDSFEGLFFFANTVMRMAGAVEFPIISFTPISIYRAVNY